MRLTAAHLDAPRVDIRTVPLYEDNGMAFFKTHYYGGIKKYQWTAIPLELRGVVCVCENGEVKRVQVRVGDKPTDPKFVITDLLPHLATEQMTRKATEVIKGEGLNILIGSVPSETVDEKCSEKIKLAIMEHLNREYGMTEADFLSAELCCVPAFNACDIGFDRSFVGAYGHDDRVCSYPAATSLFDLTETPAHTGVCLLVDKEEIGSDGVTGMQSRAFDTFMADLCRAQDVLLDECFENSVCLSADVCNAFDPNYPEVSEKRNDARANCGFALVKYTGARGKSGTSEQLNMHRRADGDYKKVASFAAVLPADDPEILVYVMLDDPNNARTDYSSILAAPVAGNIISEVAPYLGIATDGEDRSQTTVTVPNLISTEWSNAQVQLNIKGLKHQLMESASDQTAALVTCQYPHAGAKVPYGTTVYLYTDTYDGSLTEVPDVSGKSADFARQMLAAAGLNCVVEGDANGVVQSQSSEVGASVQRGTIVTITCG